MTVRDEILLLDEFQSLVSAHADLGIIRSTDPIQANLQDILSTLLSPVVRAVNAKTDLAPTDDQLILEYRLHQQGWAADYTDFDYTVPVLGLIGDLTPRAISPALHLAPFTLPKRRTYGTCIAA